MYVRKYSKIIWILLLVSIKSVFLFEENTKNFNDYDETDVASENENNRDENVEHVQEDISLWDELAETVHIDEDGKCEPNDNIKQQTSNLYPFVVIEPIVQLPDEFGNVYNSWCEGIMISDIWGIAPPNCFVKDETDYYLNLSEMTNFTLLRDNLHNNQNRKQRSHATRTFIAQLQVIIHHDIKYNFLTNTYCNYIALFKLMNFRFYFDFLIQLPKVNYRGDLYYKMHDAYPVDMSQHPSFKLHSKPGNNDDLLYQSQSIVDENEKCKVIGAQFETSEVLFSVGTFKLTSIHSYCTLFPLCSAVSCSPTFSYNLTYMDLNLPRSPAENGCSFDSGYHFGSLLVCFDDDTLEWLLYGVATNEVVLSCNGANMYNNKDHHFNLPHGYQAFTRIDAYIDWINKTVNANGGWKGL